MRDSAVEKGEQLALNEQWQPAACRAVPITEKRLSSVEEEAGPSDLPRWLAEPRSLTDTLLWRGLTAAMVGTGKLLFRVKLRGLENLPPRGPYLICPNHVSLLDGPLLHAFLPRALREQAFSVGEAAYLRGWFHGGMSRLFHVVPTDADRALRSSIRIAAAALKQGGILIIFPEGVRSPDGLLKELKHGFAILARELSLPVVPVWIDGAFEAWPRSRRWPRPGRVRVTFGAPLDVAEVVSGDATPESACREITAATTRALVQLRQSIGDARIH